MYVTPITSSFGTKTPIKFFTKLDLKTFPRMFHWWQSDEKTSEDANFRHGNFNGPPVATDGKITLMSKMDPTGSHGWYTDGGMP